MFLDLPEDILRVIFNFCDNQSSLLLIGTCNFLKNIYIPRKITKEEFNINFLCYDKIEIYEYFKKCLIHDEQFYYYLAINKYNNVIKYIGKKSDTKTLWVGATTGGNLELLIWLGGHKEKYYGLVFRYACQYGYIDILQYFNSRRFRRLYKTEYSELAAERQHLNVLKWLNDNNLELSTGIYTYIMYDEYIDIWKWLYESGNLINIVSENKLCKWATFNKSFKILKWLVKNGCYINFEVFTGCFSNNNYEMFEWIINHVPELKSEFCQPYMHTHILATNDARFHDWYYNNISSYPKYYCGTNN